MISKITDKRVLTEIYGWLAERKAEMLFDLSEGEGYWEPGVCAGFLFPVAGVILIEGLVSNPKAPYGKRQERIEALGEVLVRKAKEMGPNAVIATTTKLSVAQLGVRCGLKPAPRPAFVVGWTHE